MKNIKLKHVKVRDMMSGKKMVAIVISCLLLPAIIFVLPPLKLPFVVEAQIVIGLWWLAWVSILTKLLFRGWRIEDDLYSSPKKESNNKFGWWDAFDLGPAGDGIGGIIAGFIISILFAVIAFFLIELLLPLFAWLAYSLVLKMLRTAAHDRHDCEKNLLNSFKYAIFWATLYVLPLILCLLIVRNFIGAK